MAWLSKIMVLRFLISTALRHSHHGADRTLFERTFVYIYICIYIFPHITPYSIYFRMVLPPGPTLSAKPTSQEANKLRSQTLDGPETLQTLYIAVHIEMYGCFHQFRGTVEKRLTIWGLYEDPLNFGSSLTYAKVCI